MMFMESLTTGPELENRPGIREQPGSIAWSVLKAWGIRVAKRTKRLDPTRHIACMAGNQPSSHIGSAQRLQEEYG
jgi:hypothetical protein